MNAKKTVATIGIGLGGILMAASAAHGQGVGNIGALPSGIPMNTTGTGWDVGNAASPQTVVLDPNGPPWRKHLTDPLGGPFTAAPFQPFYLHESLVIGPTQPWTDWHEKILTPGWEWVVPTPTPPMFFANGVPAPGLSTVYTPGSPGGSTLDFYFNSLPPGTKIEIRKLLQYTDATGVAFQGVVEIEEYPTPEPASIGLLALGGIALLRRRRGGLA
ncbi:MAG: PEP-CTERM sorting domain-containing protein [Planctomycetes bacterium]|nr:PEP-CTERM sorting domain-containing protein [Planctomycetota bacterium]